MIEPPRFRAVLDTNVVLAAQLSRNPASPTMELLQRWRRKEFRYQQQVGILDGLHFLYLVRGDVPRLFPRSS